VIEITAFRFGRVTPAARRFWGAECSRGLGAPTYRPLPFPQLCGGTAVTPRRLYGSSVIITAFANT
jgi:hypothetical protein